MSPLPGVFSKVQVLLHQRPFCLILTFLNNRKNKYVAVMKSDNDIDLLLGQKHLHNNNSADQLTKSWPPSYDACRSKKNNLNVWTNFQKKCSVSSRNLL